MTKPKSKSSFPNNPPDWLRPLLFPESITYTFNAPLEQIADHLRGLEVERTSLFQLRTRRVLIMVDNFDTLRFQLEARRRNRGLDYTSALIQGRIYAPSPQQTHLQAEVRFGMGYLPFVILPPIAFVIIFGVMFGVIGIAGFIFIWSVFVFLIALATVGLVLYQDRQHLKHVLLDFHS